MTDLAPLNKLLVEVLDSYNEVNAVMNLVSPGVEWAAVGLGPGDERGRRVLPVRHLGSLHPGFFSGAFRGCGGPHLQDQPHPGVPAG